MGWLHPVPMLQCVGQGAWRALLRPTCALLLERSLSTTSAAVAGGAAGPQFCVVGSGPAGFYTADKVCL